MTFPTTETAVDRVLAALERHGNPARRDGAGWAARCPAHDDQKPSLAVTPADDRALVHCHAGCPVDAVLAELELTSADLFDQPKARSGSGRRIVATYAYKDESGTLLYEVVRYEPKDFRQRTPDGGGGWTWKLNGTRRVPYHLSEVRTAAAAGAQVFVAEGEKDADALRRAGEVATCCPGGAGKWRAEYAEHFRGSTTVLIVADKDMPGYRHARDVARSLVGIVDEVIVCQAAHGKDAADHLAAGLSVDDFETIPETELDELCEDGPSASRVQARPSSPAQKPPASTPAADPVDALTELGLARRMVRRLYGTTRFAPQLGVWLVWDGRRWDEDRTGELVRAAKAQVDQLHDEAKDATAGREQLVAAWLRFQTAAKVRAIVELASTEPGIPVLLADLDPDPMSLNVANGVIDLRTGTLRPHDPGELHTKLVDIAYDHEARCPRFERFLEEVFRGDSDVIGFVQRFAGYSLTGDVREQMFVFGHGAGSNGKSTLFNLLRYLLGTYGVQLDHTVLTDTGHEKHPTGLMDLRGARLATTRETEDGRRLAEALIKQLTGGDPITARRMHRDFVEFLPTHKIWMSGNHLPQIRGTDPGIWRRVALVPFLETFEVGSDPTLTDDLDGELPGILSWAVCGCLDWQRGGLQVPEPVKSATARYRADQDHVGRFLDDRCRAGDTEQVTAGDLRAAYESWCQENGEHPWSAKRVGAELTSRGLDSAKLHGVKTWLGIGLLRGLNP